MNNWTFNLTIFQIIFADCSIQNQKRMGDPLGRYLLLEILYYSTTLVELRYKAEFCSIWIHIKMSSNKSLMGESHYSLNLMCCQRIMAAFMSQWSMTMDKGAVLTFFQPFIGFQFFSAGASDATAGLNFICMPEPSSESVIFNPQLEVLMSAH